MDAISDVSRSSEIFSCVPKRSPPPEPFHPDEFFGFNKVYTSRVQEAEIKEGKYFDREKVFINHVDSFIGRYMIQVLTSKDVQESKLNQNDTGNATVNAFCDDKTVSIKIKGKGGDKSSKGKRFPRSKESVKHEKDDTKSIKVKRERKKKSKSSSPKRSRDDYLKEPLDVILKEEEKVPYDTSRLTVAEYYELLDLESGDERETFLKEKFSRFAEDISPDCDNLLGTPKNVSHNELKNYDYKIIGTLINDHVPEGVFEIIEGDHQDSSFLERIVRCGTIIYIVTEDKEQVSEATAVLKKVLNCIEETKQGDESSPYHYPMFILVSSFMTWALTKPLSAKDPDLPFTEKDFRKRKPHTNYQMLYELEEQVVEAKHNGAIDAAILVCGVSYGHEESTFRYLFKSAHQLIDLPIYSFRNNIIPVVHVESIAQIVKEVLTKYRHAITYPFIFAKDPFNFSQKDIVKAISANFGTSCCQIVPEAWAFLNDEITQDIFDQITANIYLESCYPLFNIDDIQWKYRNGFGTDIKHVINEYMCASNLEPLIMVLYGTTATRTKEMAFELSNICRIPYISLLDVLNEYFVRMQESIKKMEEASPPSSKKSVDGNYDKDSSLLTEWVKECEESDNIESLEYLKKLNLKRPSDVNRLTEAQKIDILKAKLLKDRTCLNRGYVLDEFPLSLEQTRLLYQINNMPSKLNDDSAIVLPGYVICLKMEQESVTELSFEVDQELVYEGGRPSQLSWIVGDTQNKIERKKRDKSVVENTNGCFDPVITILLDKNSKCKHTQIEVNKDDTAPALRSILRFIQREDLIATAEVRLDACNAAVIDEKQEAAEEKDKEELNNSLTNADALNKLKEAEEMVLALRSTSLLRYLINFIFPTLTNAILQVSEIRPDDPIDYLAEYLFRHNPDGRMFDPSKSIQEEVLLNQDKVFPKVDSKAPCVV